MSRAARSSLWPRLTRGQRENLNGYLLSGPTLLAVVLVVILPFFAVMVFAFANIRLIDIPRLDLFSINWTLDNFVRAMRSGAFWGALTTTVLFATFTTILSIGGGLITALALRRPFRGRGIVRALLLMPYVLPVVAAATIWRTMLNPQYGIVNAVGQTFLGWERPISFLTTPTVDLAGFPFPLALATVILFEGWKSAPLAFLFVTARLQSIPGEIEEAAAIDGANSWQILTRIIGPQLSGVVTLLVLLRFIWSFQSFNDIYLLTGGAGGTEVMAIKVYTELITRANIGSAAAYGLLMSALLLVLMLAYVAFTRRKEEL